MSSIILDTNAYTHLFSGTDRHVLEVVNSSVKIYISTVTIGELFEGFIGGTRFQKNKKGLKDFLSEMTTEIVNVTMETAEIYGEIKSILRKRGTPIPTNDVWIAASAMEYGAVLVTYDTHFLEIPGLRIWDELKIKN